MEEELDKYYTIKQAVEAEFKDRGSKFIAYLTHITSEDEFSSWLSEIKSNHHKANHHCFAYRLKDENHFRYNDDGEPSGTAGKPIYNQLLSNNLKDAACIVVRYFGGTKLGTSGLIHAYSESTSLAIQNSEIQTCYLVKKLILHFDYSIMGPLMDSIKGLQLEIVSSSFDANPSIQLNVRLSQYDQSIRNLKASLLSRSPNDIEEDTTVDGLRFELT